MPLQILACGLSDPGLVRHNNEDVWGAVPELRFFVLADGMGGHRAGEVAAREAVSALCQLMKKAIGRKKEISFQEARTLLHRSIDQVNSLIYKLSRSNEQYRGMGTTLCCMYFHDNMVVYAHVGDSRIYRLRNKKLEQLTIDHSLLYELMELGQLNDYQAPEFLYKNIITKAIGTAAMVEPTIQMGEILSEDIYMMCSDGLTDLLSTEEMEAILNKTPDMQNATKMLIKTANDKGGNDNITAVIMKVQEAHAPTNILG